MNVWILSGYFNIEGKELFGVKGERRVKMGWGGGRVCSWVVCVVFL